MMMDPSKISLTWDAYEKSICNGLGLLQQRGEFVDMTLAADGHHVKVHQLVLSLVSPYIKDLIKTASCPHPVIFLNRVSFDVLQYILEYVYTGEVIIHPERLDSFLEACKELHITGLQDISTKGHGINLSPALGKRKAHSKRTDPLEVLESPLKYRSKRRRPVKSEETLEQTILTDEIHDEIHDAIHGETHDEEHDNDSDDASSDPHDDEKHEKTYSSKKKRIEYLYNGSDDYEEIAPYKAGSRWVCREGHYYVVQRTKGQSLYFRCSSVNCPARWKLSMTTGAGPIVDEHNHGPTPWVPNRNSMFQALKKRATFETIPLNVIYEQEAAKYQDAIPYLSYESVAPSMRKWRRAAKTSLSRSLQSTG